MYRWTLTNLSDMSSEVLTRDPLGWDEGTYTIKRSDEYKGAFHEYSVPLKFHCKGGGKAFIDNIYETEDIDARIDVLVEYDCDGSGTFETLFNGIINLASYQTDGEYTTVTIEKSDLLTKLFSRDEISVDLETTTSIGGATITSPQTTTLPMHSMEVYMECEWGIVDAYQQRDLNTFTTGENNIMWVVPNMGIVKSDMEATYQGTESITAQDIRTNFEDQIFEPIYSAQEQLVQYPVTLDYEINFKGLYTDDETTGGGVRTNEVVQLILYWGVRDSSVNGSIQSETILDIGGYSADNYSYSFDTDIHSSTNVGQITLKAGDSVWLVWYYAAQTASSPGYTSDIKWTYEVSNVKISTRTKTDATECKTIMVHEAFNQVIDAIADSDGNFYSEFYGRTDSDKQTYASDGCGSEIAITNGLNIREFPDKPIYCSFKSLFNAMDCQHNIGMGIVNEKVRIEPLEYWFDSATKIITLPNVQKFTTRNDNSKYINKIDIGYQKWESEFRGGLNDPNAKHEYSTHISSAKNTLTRLSEFVASPYSLEFTRRKNVNRLGEEDWRYDNDNFLISCVRDAYGIFRPELYGDSFSNHANIDSVSTMYNLRLSPKRMLINHINVIASGLQKVNGYIRFVNGEGNYLMVLAKDLIAYLERCANDYNGQPLAENQNIAWNDSNVLNINPIFLPEKYEFEYPLTYTQFLTIKNNPYGYVEFYKDSDNVKQGYIMSMEYSMKTGMTNFDLIKKY